MKVRTLSVKQVDNFDIWNREIVIEHIMTFELILRSWESYKIRILQFNLKILNGKWIDLDRKYRLTDTDPLKMENSFFY